MRNSFQRTVSGRVVDIPVTEDEPLPVDLTANTIGLATETTLSEVASNTASLVTAAQSTVPVNVYPLPVTPVKGMTAQITDTTSTAVTGVGQGGSGVFNYITQITVVNADATVGTIIELQDGSSGTTFYRLPAPAAINSVGVTGSTFTFPTPLKQTTANTALYVKCTTTSADVYVSVTGFQA